MQVLRPKIQEGSYKLYKVDITGFELYIVDGKKALMLIPKSVGGDFAIGLTSDNVNIVSSFNNIFDDLLKIGNVLKQPGIPWCRR